MNAFEIRKNLMANAQKIMDEVDERIFNEKDPLTGEAWEGDRGMLFYKFKILCDFAKKSNDPLPELSEEDQTKPHIEQLQLIIDMMLAGKVDANSVDHMMAPTVAFMTAVEKQEASDKIKEINSLNEILRVSELKDMSSADLEKELEATRARLAATDD